MPVPQIAYPPKTGSPMNNQWVATRPTNTNQWHQPLCDNLDQTARRNIQNARQLYQNVDQNIRSNIAEFRHIPRDLYQNIDQNILANIPKVNTLVHPNREDQFDPPPKKKKPKPANNSKKKKSKLPIGSFTVSAASLFSGAFMFLAFDPMINFVLEYNFQLRPDGLTTQAWLRNPIPIYSCWYLFGIKNGDKYFEGAKPKLQEFGPFCYDIYRNRTIVEWKENSVRYLERFQFEFNHEQSTNIDTQIRMINLPLVAAVLAAKNLMETYYVSFLGPIVFNTITIALKATGEKLVLDISARMLMEGWEVNIIKYFNQMMAPLRSVGLPLPDFDEGFIGIIGNSFGITSSVSYFTTGPFEAYTKTENGHVVGQIFNYDKETKYAYYKEPCNKVGGSDGIFYPRPVEAKNLYIYIHHLCRVLPLERGISHYYKGSQTIQYGLDKKMFDMSLTRNRCFCRKKRWQDCDGWTDVSQCIFGLPLGLSFPHYYNSPRRLKDVIGLKPNPEKHYGYMEVEPQLGLPVGAQIKLQGVLTVEPISSVSALSKLPNYPLPVGWVKIFQGADTPLLASLLFVGSNGLRYGSYGFLLGGMGLSGLFFSLGLWKKAKRTQNKVNYA